MKRMTDFGLSKEEAAEITELVKMLIKDVGLDVRELNKAKVEISLNSEVSMENMRVAIDTRLRMHLNNFSLDTFMPLTALNEQALSKESFTYSSNEDNYVVKKVMVRLDEILLLMYGKFAIEIKRRIRKTVYHAVRHLCQIQIPSAITNAPWNQNYADLLRKIVKLPSISSSFPEASIFGKPFADHATDFPEFGKTEFFVEKQSFQNMIKFPVESIVGDLGFFGNDIPESIFNSIIRKIYPESKGRKIEHYLRDSVEKKIRALQELIVAHANAMKELDRNVYSWHLSVTDAERIDFESLKRNYDRISDVMNCNESGCFTPKRLNESFTTYYPHGTVLRLSVDDVFILFTIPGLVRVTMTNDSVSNNIEILIVTDVVKMTRQDKILLLAKLNSFFSRPEGVVMDTNNFNYYVEQIKEQIKEQTQS